MTLIEQMRLIALIVLALTVVELGLIVWLCRRPPRECRSPWTITALPETTDNLPPAVREDPELGTALAVRLSVGDGPQEEVGAVSRSKNLADDMAHLMRALAVEFETTAAERKGGPVAGA